MYINNQDDILKLINNYMIDNDIKQKDIVEATGLSKQTVSNLLNGRNTNMTLNSVFNLINALDCNLFMSLDKHKKELQSWGI